MRCSLCCAVRSQNDNRCSCTLMNSPTRFGDHSSQYGILTPNLRIRISGMTAGDAPSARRSHRKAGWFIEEMSRAFGSRAYRCCTSYVKKSLLMSSPELMECRRLANPHWHGFQHALPRKPSTLYSPIRPIERHGEYLNVSEATIETNGPESCGVFPAECHG